MSHACEISFKTITENELYDFFVQFKKSINERLNEIAEEIAFYCPSERFENSFSISGYKSTYEKLPENIIMEIDKAWVYRVFTYKFFYLPEHNLLGIFNVPDKVTDIFDCTCYFQNSCDQDYDYEYWQGIPVFEKIADKWRNASVEDITSQCKLIHNYEMDTCDNTEYYRKSFAYNEIWEMFEKYLYDDDNAVSISLFNSYEGSTIRAFITNCKETAKRKINEYKSRKD